MKKEEIEQLKKDNFRSLVLSYAADMREDTATIMAEKALRGLAKQWSGCISCSFSRKYKASRIEGKKNESWTHRICALGLQQSTCGEHLGFPPEEIDIFG